MHIFDLPTASEATRDIGWAQPQTVVERCELDHSWYVIQAKPKQELRALKQLENQGYTCFLPTLSVKKTANGKVKTYIEPLFSRYLFVQFSVNTTNWGPIRSTRGVSKIVAFGGRFATLPSGYVEALRKVPSSPPTKAFEPGENISITDGPFAGLEAVYHMPDGDARAMVLIEFMNRPQKVIIGAQELRKVA